MVNPDYAFRREFGRVLALCPNHDVCGFEGKVEKAVVRNFIALLICKCYSGAVYAHWEMLLTFSPLGVRSKSAAQVVCQCI